jgi:hypothetical protein
VDDLPHAWRGYDIVLTGSGGQSPWQLHLMVKLLRSGHLSLFTTSGVAFRS